MNDIVYCECHDLDCDAKQQQCSSIEYEQDEYTGILIPTRCGLAAMIGDLCNYHSDMEEELDLDLDCEYGDIIDETATECDKSAIGKNSVVGKHPFSGNEWVYACEKHFKWGQGGVRFEEM